jgi:type VI protein secretion system component Hcp
VLFTSSQFGAGAGGVTENVSFTFARIDSDILIGGQQYQGCWEVAQNQAC